jgi:formylglycine-generating enzyme required for sulfatase activity
VLKRVAEDTPRAIREIIPETPQWLCDIIAKLHAKNPDDRYKSAREVADVLANCEAQLKANARLKDYRRIPRGKPRRSGRWKWVAIAAAVLLPMIALVVTEFAGVTHLFSLGPPKKDAEHPGPAADASFDAKAAQEASAKQLGIPVETTNSIGMKLWLIPPGKFTMGSSTEEIDFWLTHNVDSWVKGYLPGEAPQHEVEITQPFYLGQTAVTVGQYRQFVMATGYKTQAEREGGATHYFPNGEEKTDADTNWLNPGFDQTDDHPVVCVSWNDAVEFCNWLSKEEGKTYRLPTEAVWEHSCRAGSKGRWCFGDDEGELLNYARIRSNSQRHTWPVAGLKANAWALYDMHGNAWEWCQDAYDANYYKTSPPKDPPGPAAGEPVIRGGSWNNSSVACRSAFREHLWPGWRSNNLGFRVVLVVSPPAGVRTESGAKDKPSSPAIPPLTDADVQRIAALPAEQQVEEVRKELVRRSPGFNGALTPTIEDDVVTGLAFSTEQVSDLSPVRALTKIKSLKCAGGKLSDISPLRGSSW